MHIRTAAVGALVLLLAIPASAQVTEYPIVYPNATSVDVGACHPAPDGSTHEITFNGRTLWITGQNYDQVVSLTEAGAVTFHPMPHKSGPHGIEFDRDNRLWVTLEFDGKIVRLDKNGNVEHTIDVGLDCPTCPGGKKINPSPHGLGFGSDGRTMWFTGKATGTIGKVAPDGKITTYPLKTVGSVPIYVRAGNDGTMWVTELVGNKIARITADGNVEEFPIPTANSRPIAIVPEPGSNAMWFSEEAGNRVARIAPDGKITEFALPLEHPGSILAGLAFDNDRNLWVQQYVGTKGSTDNDSIIRIDKSILTAPAGDISKVPITYYKVPTTHTVMHRITQGPDGNMWFTELAANKVGKLVR